MRHAWLVVSRREFVFHTSHSLLYKYRRNSFFPFFFFCFWSVCTMSSEAASKPGSITGSLTGNKPGSKSGSKLDLDLVQIESQSSRISSEPDMFDLEDNDIALTKKMHLVNNALDEIGFTWFNIKYLIIAGYGYAADSLLGFAQSTVQQYVNYQFNQSFPISTEVIYAGYLVGCIFWGTSADIIGRKWAFNVSLLLSSIFGFVVGGASSFPMYCLFLALSSFCLGGNLAIDATVFMEFLPHKWSFLTTAFACFWSLGQFVAYLVAYLILRHPGNVCDSAEDCDSRDNRGWRYVWYADSAIVLVLALVRLLLKLDETPKFLVSNNRDEEAFELLSKIATRYNRPLSLTLDDLLNCGEVQRDQYNKERSVKKYFVQCADNTKALFRTKKMALNTGLLFASWGLIGIAYPLYSVFLPMYLEARGANTEAGTVDGVYRDAMISNALSFFGPIIGGALILIPKVGRKGCLCVGGLLSMVFLMCYTTVRTHAQNLAFSTVSYITIYIYYGCLYAITPEVLPSYCRTTGSGLSFVFNRACSLFVPVIAHYSDTATSAPIYVTAAVVGLLGIMALFFPFDPSKLRSV